MFLQLCDNIQQQYPYSLQVVTMKVALEEHHQGPEAALQTASRMMELWRGLYSGQVGGEGEGAEVASGHTAHQDGHSIYNMSEDNDNGEAKQWQWWVKTMTMVRPQ